ncbi:hypothetical protein EJB05_03870 [Eragrostis curvula]|uniref:Uncharacterized protein n=1 Tax=Eragrostis curvula TaxID=38414 RepID=A0A5J9W7W9_9POAL|nr:hypothetical protein EJB05_03870 [Eragrostis curvula]
MQEETVPVQAGDNAHDLSLPFLAPCHTATRQSSSSLYSRAITSSPRTSPRSRTQPHPHGCRRRVRSRELSRIDRARGSFFLPGTMARGRPPAALLLPFAVLLLLGSSAALAAITSREQPQASHKHSGLSPAECAGACDYRCSKTQYRKACLTFCNKCCAKCRCVPPGTYGHKEACPCYNNWKTKRGGPKCP